MDKTINISNVNDYSNLMKEVHSAYSENSSYTNQDFYTTYDMLCSPLKEGVIDSNSFTYIEDEGEKYYNYYGLKVPRVTSILNDVLHPFNAYTFKYMSKESKRQYFINKKIALDTGSLVHSMIDHYIDPNILVIDKIDSSDKTQAECSFNNYLSLIKELESKNIHIDNYKYLEYCTICPAYGGTIDAIADISFCGNQKRYIIDFKTSKYISIDYLLQTTMYSKSLEYNRLMHNNQMKPVDGIAIFRVDKYKSNNYNYIFIDYQNDPEFMYRLNNSVDIMVQHYYNMKSVQYYFKEKQNEHKDYK